jgi:hypothetical protein
MNWRDVEGKGHELFLRPTGNSFAETPEGYEKF